MGYWGDTKTLFERGGQVHYLENLVDKHFDNIVVSEDTERMSFRVSNPTRIDGKENSDSLKISPPIVHVINEAEMNDLYPVLRGHGA